MKDVKKNRIKAMSLFANVGIAETYLEELGVDVVLANEIEKERAEFYKKIYPKVEMLIGDITDVEIQQQLVRKGKTKGVELLIATPPCQGMSTAGKKEEEDPRNLLIKYAVEIAEKIEPKYIFFENVPEQLLTKIMYKGKNILIPSFIREELGNKYEIRQSVVNAADYGVPQSRERAIFLLSLKSNKNNWEFPKKKEKRKTLREAIGDLPILDPLVSDISYDKQIELFPQYEKHLEEAKNISKWHIPPKHVYRQVLAMMHTPTGKSAFENEEQFKPRKLNGEIVKGYNNTYKRQDWDKPAFTVTMYNRTIGSQNNVHPGRFLGKDEHGKDVYSDPRVLTIFELMRVTSLPDDWNIPEGYSDNFIRSVIGEGIPPLMVKKIMEELPNEA